MTAKLCLSRVGGCVNVSSNRGLRRLVPHLEPAEKKILTTAAAALGVGSGVAQFVGPFAHSGLALLVITLVVALVGTVLLAVAAMAVNRRRRVRGKPLIWALALLFGVCAGGAIGYVTSSAASGASAGGAPPRPASSASISSSSPQPTLSPITSYSDKATAPYQDVEVGLRPQGYVRQPFTAASSQIELVIAIFASQTSDASAQVIGKLRVTLYELAPDGSVGRALPLALDGSPGPATVDGVLADAGPNHKDTRIDLQPVAVQIGHRYAIQLTNADPQATLAVSLRPHGSPQGAVTVFTGESGSSPSTYTDRALAGVVCNTTDL